MKKIAIVLLLLLSMLCVFTACDSLLDFATYTIQSEKDSYTITIGQEVDFKSYFVVKDSTGIELGVTDAMLDLSAVDTTKEGSFTVTCTVGTVSKTITFVVVEDGNQGGEDFPIDLSEVFAKYDDYSKWNFEVTYDLTSSDEYYSSYGEYGYEGANCWYNYSYSDIKYTDYIIYDKDFNIYLYNDNGDGTHTIYMETDDEFQNYFYYDYLELIDLNALSFEQEGDHYTATNPATAGNSILGEYDLTYTDVDLYIANGVISKITAVATDGTYTDTYTIEFSHYGEVTVDVSALTLTNDNPGGTVTPPSEDVDVSEKITTTFVDQYLDCLDGGLTFTTDSTANGFHNERGVQYLQRLGDVALVGPTLTGVTNVSVVVCTNHSAGMDVAVMVGNTWLTSGEQTKVTVSKYADYNDHLTKVTFVSDTPLSGGIVVNLIAKGSSESMYIKEIIVNDDSTDGTGGGTTTNQTPVDMTELFEKYDDYAEWNFELVFGAGYTGYDYTYYFYGYQGWDCWMMYEYYNTTYVDYITYDDNNSIVLYYDNGDGTHTQYLENDDDFWDYYYVDYLDLTLLSTSQFYLNGDHYSALSPSTVGNNVLGEDIYYGATYVSFDIYVKNGVITKIVATQDDDYGYILEFSNYGKATVDVSNLTVTDGTTTGGGSQGGDTYQPVTPSGEMMPAQSYDESTHSDDRLHQMIEKSNDSIGLPSLGNVTALVVPVQFSTDKFTSAELTNLNIAFNGTSAQTGWESVKSYYQKSSYGKLNLSFDKSDTYTASKSVSSYERSTNGSHDILLEVLSWLESKTDLSKYDTNNDGCIDAVYLIYSVPVNYDDDDSMWWAYVSWSQDNTEYDGVVPYYYFFAGIDFMTEDLDNTMKINATTYIHETGHLLGLDDYYDYYPNRGSDMGLGGADMMDYTVGDHNPYSKIMLGWITPTIVTSTQTLTIQALESSGQCIMLLLDYDGTYFSEYLLIDLFSNTGLNEYHANQQGRYLYYDSATGISAPFGARIYHVSSSCKQPYSDSYSSFTDNNNSLTAIPLIKLVEADGDTNYQSDTDSNGYVYAADDDLWQTGSSLKKVFENFTRHDGKEVNFDIRFDSVTATSATITITFA